MIIPRLMQQFKNAQFEVYGHSSHWIQYSYAPKFAAREVELAQHRISTGEYARVVCKLWRNWVKCRELHTLPPGVFVGNISRALFNHYLEKPFVELDMDTEEVRNAKAKIFERSFAVQYIQYKLDGGEQTEEQFLDDYLSNFEEEYEPITAWLDAMELGERGTVTQQVIDHLVKITIPAQQRLRCSSYDQFIDLHRSVM